MGRIQEEGSMKTVFKNARIIDGKGGLVENGFVGIEGNKILQVGKGDPPIPLDGFETVNLEGLSILPGFIDCHVHFRSDGVANPRQQVLTDTDAVTTLRTARNARRTLEAGITTVRDCGSKNLIDFSFRRAVQEGICLAPRLVLSGKMICMTGGHGWPFGREADGPDEVRKAAREILKAGADNVKFMATGGIMTEGTETGSAQFTVEEMRAGIEEAQKAGKITAAHAQGATGIKNAIRAGISSIEHGYFLDDEGIELMLERGVYLVATASAVRIVIEKGVKQGVPEYAVRKAKGALESHISTFKRAYKAGVKMAMGTDAGNPYNNHGENLQELCHLVEMGLTPMEAVQVGTLNGARLLRLDHLIGSIEEGKLGDLVVFQGNPLDDVSLLSDSSQLKWVIQGGECVMKRD